MTSKTNLGLVQWCHDLIGQPYWFGTCAYKATESLLRSKAQQYPSHYKDSRMARYRADIKAQRIVSDCVGMIKGFYWTRDDGTMKYGLDGRPDKGANGMFQAAQIKGPISTLPEVQGLLLYSPGHVGVYIGGGWAIEARGFDYGVVRTRVSERNWTYWYRCPYIDYVDGDMELPEPKQRDLYYIADAMMRGEDVCRVQSWLADAGFAPGKLDGIYGPKTEAAVRAFQKKYGLEVNGDVDSTTWAALEKRPETPAPEEEKGTEDEPSENPPEAGQDPSIYGTRLLKYTRGRGMPRGEDVRNVQTRLVELGYIPGKIDGIYGPNTSAAVKVLQEEAGIKVDGIVGPDTRAQLSK